MALTAKSKAKPTVKSPILDIKRKELPTYRKRRGEMRAETAEADVDDGNSEVAGRKHARNCKNKHEIESVCDLNPQIILPLTYSKQEARCVMRFLSALGESPAEIHRQMRQVYGKVISRSVVFKWCKDFRQGRNSLEDNKRSGRPKNKKLNNSSEDILGYIKTYKHANLREVGFHVKQPTTTVYYFIKQNLCYRMFLGCWIPTLLSEELRQQRLNFCAANLGNPNLMRSVLIADETWLNFLTTPVKKRCAPTKNEQGEVVKAEKKFRTRWNLETGPSPAISILMNVFWDSQGVVAVNFHQQPVKNDADLHLLYEQVCLKRPNLLLSGAHVLLNSAEDVTVKERLLSFGGWQGVFVPTHSPDLAPSDYHLFQPLKKHVCGKRFNDADAGKRCVLEWFWAQDADFYAQGVQQLVSRWDNCVKLKGNYLEK